MAWWGWLLFGWTAVAVVVAVVLGLAVREADRRERDAVRPAVPAPAAPLPPPDAPRRRIPAPPVTVLLAATGVSLEALGFVLRAAGADRIGPLRLLSMDAPLSVPRLFITGLFAVAAFAAAAGAVRLPGRRAWWAAVAVVAGIVAEVKGGGSVHVWVLATLGIADRPGLALAGSAAVVTTVLSALWWMSRTERRDRRRVLLAFALYGFAGGVLSSLSTVVAQHRGGASYWTAVATFVEEGGEVLAAVSVLTAVLVGVAPRLVLPPDWALRRAADAATIDAVEPRWAAGLR